MNRIFEGDCLEVLATLPDNSIDLICTDPPYFNVKGGGNDGGFEWWDRQWDKPAKFLKWLDSIAAEWARVLKPNGSLYCFASPKMAARVEVRLGERFEVLNRITWAKHDGSGYGTGGHSKVCKEELRCYFPQTESIIFCEHYGADNAAKGEAGYGAKCDELRGFVFEPLRAYLDGERERSGLTVRQVAEAFQRKTGSRTVTGMAGHWFKFSQWELPTEENYLWLQRLLNELGRKPAPRYEDFHSAPRSRFEKDLRADCEYLRREYEELRREYEELRREYEELRREYEELRRPFSVSADVPYTDVWAFPTVQAYKGKHPCEKPAAMLEHIVLASSRPDGVVFDCFCGSGNTLVAAKKHGRQFIGIDIDPHWVDVARGRVGQTQQFVSLEDRLQWLETQVRAQGQKVKRIEPQQMTIFDALTG